MGHLHGKYKGKTGKIDTIEDLIGTEELSGTYKGREKNWKIIKHEKRLIADWQEKQMEKIRLKREEEIRVMLADQVKVLDINQKIGFLLPFLLDNDAYRYLFTLRQLEPKICQTIMHYLFSPEDLEKLDIYVEVITKRGYGPKDKISLITVMKIERLIRGTKPKIEVERDGERRRIG